MEEYNKLLEQIEDAKAESKAAYGQDSLNLTTKVSAYSLSSAKENMAKIKNEVSGNFNELMSKFSGALNFMESRLDNELKIFRETQEAIEASKAILENHYHLKISAEALALLIDDYSAKKKGLENDFNKLEEELKSEITAKKRDWAREQEEYAYDKKTAQARDEREFSEKKQAREKILESREQAIKSQEADILKFKKQADDLPAVIEKEVKQQENELKKKFDEENKIKLAMQEQEWTAKKDIYEIRLKNLNDQLEKQKSEIMALRKDLETAAKKVQEMAIKVIESGAAKTKTAEETVKASA